MSLLGWPEGREPGPESPTTAARQLRTPPPNLGDNALSPEDSAAKKEASIVQHLRDGLRVILLGDKAPPLERHLRQPLGEKLRRGTTAQVLRVLDTFLTLRQDEGHGREEPAPCRAVLPAAGERTAACELRPLRCITVMDWVEQAGHFSKDVRYGSVCGACLRSLKAWRRSMATPAQRREGVSLAMLLQWTWSAAECGDIAEMLAWTGCSVMTLLRQQTPRLINPQEQRDLEKIFKEMGQGRGFCTAVGIAVGENLDTIGRMRNVVDAGTAEAVFGEGEIALPKFLEFMCAENLRGHDGVTVVDAIGGGQRLLWQCREALGYSGWILEVPSREVRWRCLADELEAEVLHWRALSAGAGAGPA